MGTAKGTFVPKHPEKYLGDPSTIRYMSSWERNAFVFLDNNVNILRWASEEISIPYIKPTDGKVHKYIPDLFIVYKDKDGNVKCDLCEVKPMKHVKQTKKSSPYDLAAIAINHAKFEAAQQFCAQHGWNFRILTENDIFLTKK